MTTFSERMTAARKDKKLTQDQVAQALGVPRPTACMRLSRGRKRLRWLIETEGRNEP